MRITAGENRRGKAVVKRRRRWPEIQWTLISIVADLHRQVAPATADTDRHINRLQL